MGRVLKWLAFGLAGCALLLIAVAVALQYWLRTDDFRARVEKEAAAALGVPVKLGRLSIDLWPLPAVAVDQVRVQTQPPLTVERVEARPVWAALLAGRLEVSTLVVRKAVLPQTAIAALGAAMQKRTRQTARKQPSAPGAPIVWPRSVVLDDITWIDEKGQRSTVDAKAGLGADGYLDDASFKVVAGRFAGTHGQVKREGDDWPLRVDIGGGRIAGKLHVQPGKAAGTQVLSGQLTTENVEVSALTAPSRPLTGKLQAQTTLRSEFREPGQVVDLLTTQTRFTVRDAVVQGIDLARAVETVGLSRGGITRLNTLAGQVATQGKAVQLTNLVATSGGLSATGNVAMAANRNLSGQLVVDLSTKRGAVGVPLAVGGTMDAPSVTLTRGALASAAMGTVLLPGTLGDKLRGLFGGK